ncbi:MAG: aromatic-ring-hydroxylating dioxygenase subunit beta [bacterium]|jgi:3-phenylpropionate/cinnamic acid dioxygenase small subunit|nr:benzoate 1,2-dioxygenase small subunit [Gammaproteobacteria bacterium]HIL84535.1 benzoate 1,2-dioxygenase small subunit [Pseudomonadales bacterium]
MSDTLRESVTHTLYMEAEYLDEKRWDEWLGLFSDDCEYWLPSWDTELEYTSDPANELSLMYYDSRIGLEDRVFRIKTGTSSASSPLPRTCHQVSNIRPTLNDDGTCDVKTSWVVHYFKFNESHQFFGHYEYLLTPTSTQADSAWKIQKKKIIVQNDLIPAVLDIYHI